MSKPKVCCDRHEPWESAFGSTIPSLSSAPDSWTPALRSRGSACSGAIAGACYFLCQRSTIINLELQTSVQWPNHFDN